MLSFSIQTMQKTLRTHGKELPVSEELLLLCSSMDSYAVDFKKLKHLNNLEFFQALFICLFKRFPDKANYDGWEKSINSLSQDVFQRMVLLTLCRSPECKIKKTFVVNCPLVLEAPVENCTGVIPPAKGLAMYNKYHALYMKLPHFIRKILKKLLRKRMLGSA